MGIVTETSDPDEEYRVKVTFPWLGNTDEGVWARVSEFSSGEERGTYYLPEVNDGVLVTFNQGDLRRPVIVGKVWDEKDAPSTIKNDDLLIFGVFRAKVVGTEEEEENRICVNIPTVSSDEDGVWARVSALDSGKTKGSFFMPETDDEVVVGFKNGKIDQPILIGSVLAIEEKSSDVREVSPEEFLVKSGNGLFINGELWRRVESLEFAGPQDKVFELDPETGTVQFGDGKRGATPFPGTRNRAGSYREGGGKYSGVKMKPGKVALDEDYNITSKKCFGIYRGVVVDNTDPKKLMRLKVNIPTVYTQNQSVWASPCTHVGSQSLPSVGDSVWVLFEQGDPDYPVWMGKVKAP
jgi:phage baseplate assembly protein gpV